jgi:hypothetical protein
MLPALITGGRMAMQALPYITAAMGALPGIRKGDIGQAVLGGGLGYLGGSFGAGKLGSAQKAATTGLGEVASGVGPVAGLAGNLQNMAKVGIPLAGVALGAPLIGGLASGAGGAVSRGAGNVAQGVIGTGSAMGVGRPEPGGQFVSPGGAVPAGFEDLTGLPTTYRVIDPTKEYAASRLAEELAQDVQLKGMKKMMPYMYQAAEARSKSEMERQMAAAQIRQNISTAANLVQRGQQAAQQMGLTAAQQMGSALTAQYQYQ